MAQIKLSNLCEDCRELPVMTRPHRKFRKCEDCRRHHVQSRLAARKVRRTLSDQTGGLVQYHDGTGWRCGYLLKLDRMAASIQPIGTKSGSVPDTIRIELTCLKDEKMKSATMPTVQDYYKRAGIAPKVPLLVPGHAYTSPAPVTEIKNATPVTAAEIAPEPKQAVAAEPAQANAGTWDPARAVELFKAGMKISDIAVEMGYPKGSGCNRTKAALKKAGVL